jgi:mRNA interferase RelE/StbE
MNQVIYSEDARKDLLKIDGKIAKRIIKKILYFSQQEYPLHYAKKLTNPIMGHYRFRIGDYRAIFDVDKNGHIQILMILSIKHRKDVYNL